MHACMQPLLDSSDPLKKKKQVVGSYHSTHDYNSSAHALYAWYAAAHVDVT